MNNIKQLKDVVVSEVGYIKENSRLAEMRKRNPPATLEAFIMADQAVTETDVQTIQAEQSRNYANRERIPEAYLSYCDSYVEMCGKDGQGNWSQEPNKRVFTDWLLTFDEWKQEHLTIEHIQAAFIKANSDQGFPVGRPGSLTTTAIALKTKITATIQPQINAEAIDYTKKLLQEKYDGAVFVPRPANLARPTFKAPGKDR